MKLPRVTPARDVRTEKVDPAPWSSASTLQSPKPQLLLGRSLEATSLLSTEGRAEARLGQGRAESTGRRFSGSLHSLMQEAGPGTLKTVASNLPLLLPASFPSHLRPIAQAQYLEVILISPFLSPASLTSRFA